MLDMQRMINEPRIRLCLDCGKCTVVCPVARYDTEFNPRLIVQGALGQNRHSPVDERIWSCITCNMCIERCNYNVQFTDFITSLRHKALLQGFEVQYSHGGTPQAIMHMMAHREIRQNRLEWLPKDIDVQKKCDTAFFVGCAPYFDVLFSDLGVKTAEGSKGALRLLNRAGVPFTVLPNERCCGRDLLLMGDTERFLALVRANVHEFNRRGIKNIITSCPECYYTLKVDYPRFHKEWNISVTYITEKIVPLIEDKSLELGVTEQRVTYHDPCTLGRYLRIFDQPRLVLGSMKGLEMVEMADNREKALCCGASPWVQCGSVNKLIQQERLAQAGSTGADTLVTACPKCQIHLKCAQKSLDRSEICQIEIRDLFDLAAQSLSLQEVS